MIDPLGIKKNDPLGLKKKVATKPVSQEELWGSDSQPQDLYTSLAIGAQEPQQVSDGLDGAPSPILKGLPSVESLKKKPIQPKKDVIETIKDVVPVISKNLSIEKEDFSEATQKARKESKTLIDKKQINQRVSEVGNIQNEYIKSLKEINILKKELSDEKSDIDYQISIGNNTPEFQEKITLHNNKVKENLNKFNLLKDKSEIISYNKKVIESASGNLLRKKAEQGNWFGALYNKMLEGVSSMSSGASSLATDLISEAMPSEYLLNPKELKELKDKGLDQDKIDDYIKKSAKKDILPIIRKSNVELLGDKGTTKEYIEKKQASSLLAGGILGLAESAPAMIGGVYGRAANFFLMGTDAVNKEMESNPEFKNITENEKLAVTIPIGIANAVLEEFGLQNIIKNNSLVNRLIHKTLLKVGANSSANVFRRAMNDEVKSGLSAGAFKLATGFAGEAVTGGSQQAAEIGVKDIYNVVKDKRMFQTPETLSDAIYEISDAAIMEGIGGTIMSTLPAINKAINNNELGKKSSDFEFELLDNINENSDEFKRLFVSDLKNKIIDGKIDKEEANSQLKSFDKMIAVFNRMPKDMSIEGKKNSFDLLIEKENLTNEISGKDESLSIKQKERISEINKELSDISLGIKPVVEEVVEPRIKDSQIPLKRETFEVLDMNDEPITVEVVTRKDGSRRFVQKVDGDFAGSTDLSKDNALSTEEYVNGTYGDIQGEVKVEQGNDIMSPAMKDKLTPKQKAELGIEEAEIIPVVKEVVKPTEEQILKDVSEGNLATFTYKDKSEVPDAFKDKISSEGEVNGEKFVRVTVAKSLADYELSKASKPVVEAEVTPEVTTTTETEPITEEVTTEAKTKAEQYSEELDKTKESDPEAYWSVSPVSAEDAAKGTIIDTPDGAAIVKPDGDIAGLFKKATSKAKGVAQDLLKRAVAAGGKKLDNFDTYLTPQYVKAGFRVVSRTPFNEEYAPEGWNKEKHGTPDVVAMIYDPENKLDIEEKTFDDYNDAIAYRDSFLQPSIEMELEGLAKLFDESDNKYNDTQVDKARTALKQVLPGTEIIIHNTTEEYNKAVGDNSRGSYIKYSDGRSIIHINKQKANGRTVAHEVFHAVILDRIKGDKSVQEITARMMKAVYKTASPALREELDNFAEMYSDESIRDEEKLSELIGIIAEGYPEMSPANKGIIKRWLDALAKMIGRKPFTDNEVIDMLNTLARKVSTGEVVSTEDVKILGKDKSSLEKKRRQAVTLMEGTEDLIKYGLQKGKNITRKVGEALEKRQREKYGYIEQNDRSESAKNKISNWMVDEVKYFVKTMGDKSGKGWYGEKYQKALDNMSKIFPEMEKDKNARDLFTILVSITSDGQKVLSNFKLAAFAYDYYKKNGVMPSTLPGQRTASFEANLKRINKLLSDYNGDIASIKKDLMEIKSIEELNKERKKEGLEPLKTSWPVSFKAPFAASVFGPKLGMFYSNLSGNEAYPTLDRWWSRTFNRYRGTLIPEVKGGITNKGERQGIDRFKQLLGDINMSDEEAILASKTYRDSYAKKGYKNGSETEKAANTIYKIAYENLNDAPFNKTDRQFMYDSVSKALSKLNKEGYDLSIADVQAILWYFEKNLYKTLGVQANIEGISYEDAANTTFEKWSNNNKSFDYNIKESEDDAGVEGADEEIKRSQLTDDKYVHPGFDAALEAAGETEESISEWEKKNAVKQQQKRTPKVQEAAEKYFNEEISQDELLDIVKKEMPIKSFTKVPSIPTFKDLIGALDKDKVAKGIVGLTKKIADGVRVASRLDIPAYERFDKWVVSVHDGIKDGLAIAYGQTAVLKNVDFSSFPGIALNIARGKVTSKGTVTAKTPMARIFGDWVNEDPQSVHDRAVKLMNDPEWVQVGMNPFRHSWFYDKADGMPIKSAEEVIQVGALVLAKKPVKVSPDDPMFKTKSAKGNEIRFQQAKGIDEMVKIAKEAKYTDAAISAFLKTKGYSIQKITNAILSYDKKYIEARQKEEGVFTREGRNKLITSLDSFKRMFLSARSFLSKTTFIAKEGIDAGIKAQSKIASYLVSDLDNAIKKYDGDKEKLISDFDKFIRGEEVELPDNFIEIGNAMRNHVDKLSYELIKSGTVDEYQSENIKKNIGSYLNRSYEVFDKKNWASKVDELTLQSAKNYLKKQLLSEATKEAKESGLDVDILLERKANQAIANLLNKENAQSFVSSGKTGSKDVSILKEKSDIPLEIRALMGEYTDPAQNYSRTIFKIASLVNNAKFLNTVKNNGMNVYLFKEKTGEFNTQIAGKESETMNPLNGLYTTKEIAGALKESAGILNTIETALPFEIAGTVKSTYEYYMKLLGSVKHLKTIESVGTHFKNVSGNVTFMLANGYFKPDAYRQSAKVIYNDFFNKTDKELREKMQEYIEAGIVDQSAVLGELRSMFKDEDFDKSFERRMNSEKLNPANSFIDKIKRLGKKTISIAENAYQAEDDYFKIVAYETEKSRYARAIYTKEYSDLSAIEKKDVIDKVSEMVKNILPNYGRVAGAVKMVKAFPIVGTFISFQTEALRTAYNIVNLSVTELKSSNPEIKKIGALRMTGIISSQAVKYAVMYLIGGAVLGDDDDEKKEKAKEFVAPWSKNSNIVITDESNGKFSYVDFSASDPFGGIVKPMNAALGGEDLLDGFVKGLQELVTPFTTPDILRSMFSDILENKNSYGGTLYNPSDSFENKSSAIVARVYKTFEPGTVTSVRKISGSDNPLNEMAGQFTGYKSNDVDILKDFGFKISAMKKKEIETRSIYNRAVNKFKNKEVTDAELQAAYLQSNKATIDNYKELKKSYDAALYFGTDRKEIKESMKDAYVSADVIIGIVTGKFKDLKKKKGIETDAQLKARNPLVYRKLMLFRARHRK